MTDYARGGINALIDIGDFVAAFVSLCQKLPARSTLLDPITGVHRAEQAQYRMPWHQAHSELTAIRVLRDPLHNPDPGWSAVAQLRDFLWAQEMVASGSLLDLALGGSAFLGLQEVARSDVLVVLSAAGIAADAKLIRRRNKLGGLWEIADNRLRWAARTVTDNLSTGVEAASLNVTVLGGTPDKPTQVLGHIEQWAERVAKEHELGFIEVLDPSQAIAWALQQRV